MTNSKLREKFFKDLGKYGLSYRQRDDLASEICQAISEELDEFTKIIDRHKDFNSQLHGLKYCKSCNLMEELEVAIKEMKGRLK